jgi:glycosyltransferase involved in cell wall biosynthesis
MSGKNRIGSSCFEAASLKAFLVQRMYELTASASKPAISVIIPAKNEEKNIAPLVAELEVALATIGPFEVIYVNDGSTDGMEQEIARLAQTRAWLRQIPFAPVCALPKQILSRQLMRMVRITLLIFRSFIRR